MNWQSDSTVQALRARAKLLKDIRDFFSGRQVLEVDTPLLMQGVNNDPFIAAFKSQDQTRKDYFLQTSPEFAMKRLLATHTHNGLGAIYYLGKAFRQEEYGPNHNPEFTILEWYRPEWDHLQLITEVSDLMANILDTPKPTILDYADLFSDLGINPHTATQAQLADYTKSRKIGGDNLPDLDAVGWLEWIFMYAIESQFNPNELIVVKNFPKACAQLSKLVPHDEHGEVAARFEVYYQGYELANGYFELTDATEQKKRFIHCNQVRQTNNLPELPIDNKLISALESGLGVMSGVALGVDRLLMIKLGAGHIKEVLSFGWEHV
tara:strand:+ start:15662 stop:16627 length:966 start_codon:yes stop_codon:yes gene_type:complete